MNYNFSALCALVASFLFRPVTGSLKMGCQAPTRFGRYMFYHDNSAFSSAYNKMLYKDVIPQFSRTLKRTFTKGTSFQCATFNEKGTDQCFTPGPPMSNDEPNCGDMMDGPTVFPVSRSTADALFMATKQDWNKPLDAGRRTLFFFASYQSDLSTPGDPFNAAAPDCKKQKFPTVAEIAAALVKERIFVVFVVPRGSIKKFKARYDIPELQGFVSFVPQDNDPDQQTIYLTMAMDQLYCGTVLPPFDLTTTSTSTTSTKSCTQGGILQLLHLQDVSWSYKNDMNDLKSRMGALLNNLKDRFDSLEVALTTFVDKPIGMSGYPGDYCYKEEVSFTTDTQEFVKKLNAAPTKSGRDWKESQFDAIKYGLKSTTIGWKTPADIGGKKVVKLLLLATDAGPHVKEDLPMPPSVVDNCENQPYPTEQEMKDMLKEHNAVPIFVVTRDIFNHWTRIKDRIAPTGKVVKLRGTIDETLKYIVDAVDDVCITY